MSEVETLREAAAKLRDKADDALLATGDEPWHFTGLNYCVDRDASTYSVWSTDTPNAPDTDAVFVCDASTEEQAEYIAAMHPRLGLVIADWLQYAAGEWADGYEYQGALVIARAVLEES